MGWTSLPFRSGPRTSLIAYRILILESGRDADPAESLYSVTGTSLNTAIGRVAFALGLHGPAMAVDTACSSSLVGLHQAANSLQLQETDVVLAGGVQAVLTGRLVEMRAGGNAHVVLEGYAEPGGSDRLDPAGWPAGAPLRQPSAAAGSGKQDETSTSQGCSGARPGVGSRCRSTPSSAGAIGCKPGVPSRGHDCRSGIGRASVPLP